MKLLVVEGYFMAVTAPPQVKRLQTNNSLIEVIETGSI